MKQHFNNNILKIADNTTANIDTISDLGIIKFNSNSSILNNTKFLRESKNNSMSCIFNKKSNNIVESQLFNENNLSKGYNNYNEINTNAQNNNSIIKKKLLGDKLQKFIKINRNVMLKKNKIYNDQ